MQNPGDNPSWEQTPQLAPENAHVLPQNAGPSSVPAPSGKLPIPRLPVASVGSSQFLSARQHRRHVTRACEGCRTRKIKCDGIVGENCKNCNDAGLVCVTTEGKRDKSKRQLLQLEEKLRAVEKGFTRLGYSIGLTDDGLLEFLTSNSGSDSPQTGQTTGFPRSKRLLAFLAAHLPDHTKEDFNRSNVSRATGFIGSSSEISWLHTVSKEAGPEDNIDMEMEQPPTQASHVGEPIAARNYYIDPPEMPFHPVDVYFYPPRHVAENLFKAYIETVNPSFPIIGTTTFRAQFRAYATNPEQWPGHRWLAILNMVFAIGAIYSSNIGLECGQESHEMYFTRARKLSMEHEFLKHTDLQQIQVDGLASFYMLATGQMNRAWKLCGNTVLGAISLGLHVRNLGNHTSDESKEIRYRVWWALYTLEHRLSVITGRPSCIWDNACSTPLPLPFDEQDFRREDVEPLLRSSAQRSGQLKGSASSFILGTKVATTYTDRKLENMSPNDSLYFLQMVMITSIGRRAISELYKPEATHSSWENTKHKIQELLFDVNTWLHELPTTYDFTSTSMTMSSFKHRTILALAFYSTKIEITRPCLYRLDLNNQDPESREFCKKLAVECIESACLVVNFMPDPPTATRLYQNTQWWCLLHILMQALAILLLEISFESQHAPRKNVIITKAAQKVLQLLRIMSRNSAPSERARNHCEGLLRRLGVNPDSFDENSDDPLSVSTSRNPTARRLGKRSIEHYADTNFSLPLRHPRPLKQLRTRGSGSNPGVSLESASNPHLDPSTEPGPRPDILTAPDDIRLNFPEPRPGHTLNPGPVSHSGPPPKSPGPSTELSTIPRADSNLLSLPHASNNPPASSGFPGPGSPGYLAMLQNDDPYWVPDSWNIEHTFDPDLRQLAESLFPVEDNENAPLGPPEEHPPG